MIGPGEGVGLVEAARYFLEGVGAAFLIVKGSAAASHLHRRRRIDANERAIEDAKRLYAEGVIGEDELVTRVGHLHDWDGRP